MLTRSCVVVEELTNDRLTNKELVAAAAAGDQSAWDALVDRYSGMLWSLTRSYRLAPADAADVVQTTWLRLVENLDRIADPDRLPGWLATTARRECLRVSRRTDMPRPGDDFAAIADDGPVPGEQLLADEQDAIVWQALSKLGEACQRLIRRGCWFRSGAAAVHLGVRFHTHAPFGNRIELQQA
jgi:RNA polymerase sigma factor (sigma-70 family)